MLSICKLMAMRRWDSSMEGSVREHGCSSVWRLYTLGIMERNRNNVFPIAMVEQENSANLLVK
jgi:hypothetical protein